MKNHSIIIRLGTNDQANVTAKGNVSNLNFISSGMRLNHGLGQMLNQLADRGMYPNEVAVDLAILAASVTAADTKISRREDAQDSWTRDMRLFLPVSDVKLWCDNKQRLELMLRFLTGDIWRIFFRSRPEGMESLLNKPTELVGTTLDSVCLFSGGLDSFVGAVDLLENGNNPLFVSHYKDASTKSQEHCSAALSKQYGDLGPRHVRANVSFNKNDLLGLSSETTTRGRSFVFFALATLSADSIKGTTPIFVPENGLISLNVPLDPLRLGAWSTRTTHPFYMARWQELLDNLGIDAKIQNPYRFMTKGEMLSNCANAQFMSKTCAVTVSCSSMSKARWKELSPRHCGYCVPCLIRKASITAAYANDTTCYTIPDLSVRPLKRQEAESNDVRSFQMMHKRLSKNPDLARIFIHKAGPLSDYSASEVQDYVEVFKRGIEEVNVLIENVQVS